jgi:hypothetical protein
MPLIGKIFVLLIVVLFLIGFCFFIKNLLSSFCSGRFTKPGKLKEDREAEREVMENPQYLDVEREIGRRFPHALKSLYSNKALLAETDFYFLDPVEDRAAWSIGCFLPVNTNTVRDRWPKQDGCFFAQTIYGQYYYVPLDSDPHAPTPVFLLDLQDGEITKVSDSLTDFLNWPRISAADYHKHYG